MANPNPQKNWQTSDPLITHHLWSGTNEDGTAYQAVVMELTEGRARAVIQCGMMQIGTKKFDSVKEAKMWVEYVVLGLHADHFTLKGSVA